MIIKKILTVLLGFIFVILISCHKQPYFAGSEDILQLTVLDSTIELGESLTLYINGYLQDGSLMWDGTRVDLTVENGSISPTFVELDKGSAIATVFADNTRGELLITARSGNLITEPVKINVGVIPVVHQITASANPATLPPGGGISRISVKVYDEYYKPIEKIPVILETDYGVLNSEGSALISDTNGEITDFLNTDRDSTITINAGDKTKTVNILVEIEEENIGPTASFNYSPTSPKNLETVYFNGSGSYDDDYIYSWRWDFGDGSSGYRETTSHIYNIGSDSSKTYMVTLIVTDNKGKTSSFSQSITISVEDQNAAPYANFTYSPSSPKSLENIYFNGVLSSDSDGSIVSYFWDFGDGRTDTGSNVTLSYDIGADLSKTFTVTLTVTDNEGETGSTSKTITITQ